METSHSRPVGCLNFRSCLLLAFIAKVVFRSRSISAALGEREQEVLEREGVEAVEEDASNVIVSRTIDHLPRRGVHRYARILQKSSLEQNALFLEQILLILDD
jgi:hypothetical protein